MLDLTSVTLETTDMVTVTYEWSGAVPQNDSVLWVVTVGGVRQLGYKIVDGRFSSHFIFDFATAQQENLDGAAQLDNQRLTVSFPKTAVDDLDDGWTWQAVLNVAGTDVDNCDPA